MNLSQSLARLAFLRATACVIVKASLFPQNRILFARSFGTIAPSCDVRSKVVLRSMEAIP